VRRALPLSAPRALLLNKSVGNKFPKFTGSYPNRGAGGRAPTFGFWMAGRPHYGRVMSDYANGLPVLAGFWLDFWPISAPVLGRITGEVHGRHR
jgi:hypothetical protein